MWPDAKFMIAIRPAAWRELLISCVPGMINPPSCLLGAGPVGADLDAADSKFDRRDVLEASPKRRRTSRVGPTAWRISSSEESSDSYNEREYICEIYKSTNRIA